MQYIGKLMRSADEDALREAVAAPLLGTAQSALACTSKRWRAELIADDSALDAGCRPTRTRIRSNCAAWCARRGRDAAGWPLKSDSPRAFASCSSSSNHCCERCCDHVGSSWTPYTSASSRSATVRRAASMPTRVCRHSGLLGRAVKNRSSGMKG
jgi:hypothetical protein